ncbi:cytochrome P450 89A9-like [Mercurialis annua]|uniref:cytochrome P450 89A9-like n=1 Tax=Mercurialis annua TaxID=3986 RepID=UPI002160B85B|nr:cytochrome P450 89A9-like [Mercurialis annua]
MEPWLIVITFLCMSALLGRFVRLFFHTRNLPPGPPTVPVLGNFLWMLKSSNNFSSMEPVLRQLRAKYGPIVTLHLGSRPSIFITTHEAAHRALVQTGSLFANRPSALTSSSVFFSKQHTLSTAPYGSLWHLLRKNFMSLLHPSRLHLYSDGRKWALGVLKTKLIAAAQADNKDIVVVEHFQFAMFCLLVYICFGEQPEEHVIREIEVALRASITNFIRFNVLNFIPNLGKIVFRKLWKEVLEIRRKQEIVLLPLIKARREKHKYGVNNNIFYVDSLFDLRVPDGKITRELSDGELVSLCSEFINGGTDTSTTTLQWVMANLVKKQEIQDKLLQEIKNTTEADSYKEIEEEEVKKMAYLKAVILETLRRHPPGHFILPRAVTKDTKFDGYDIPKDAIVNFTVAEMAWDPKVWEDPMEFKPERFMNEGVAFDVKGIREIKMMPFGAGRRVCPAISIATLHLQYFVANLVRDFEWKEGNGYQVDLSETQEFTMVMKNPLRVSITPTRKL